MNKIEELRYLIEAVNKEGEEAYKKMLAPLDITPNQNEVLKILSVCDGLSVSGIGDLLICGSDSPSRVIQRLINKEFVKKESDKKDTRKSIISITNKGKDILKESTKIEDAFNQTIQETIEKEIDVDLLIAILSKQVEGSKTLNQIKRRKQDF